MKIRRIVPNMASTAPEQSRAFYTRFLGLQTAMEREEILIFTAEQPVVQISVIQETESGEPPVPDVSIEVADVESAHAKAIRQGIPIVYPLTEEEWGVRRFFVREPNGKVINILSHM